MLDHEAVKALIDAGAAVNARNSMGATALMWATQRNRNAAVITVLINAGANVNAEDRYRNTALLRVASENPNPVDFGDYNPSRSSEVKSMLLRAMR